MYRIPGVESAGGSAARLALAQPRRHGSARRLRARRRPTSGCCATSSPSRRRPHPGDLSPARHRAARSGARRAARSCSPSLARAWTRFDGTRRRALGRRSAAGRLRSTTPAASALESSTGWSRIDGPPSSSPASRVVLRRGAVVCDCAVGTIRSGCANVSSDRHAGRHSGRSRCLRLTRSASCGPSEGDNGDGHRHSAEARPHDRGLGAVVVVIGGRQRAFGTGRARDGVGRAPCESAPLGATRATVGAGCSPSSPSAVGSSIHATCSPLL